MYFEYFLNYRIKVPLKFENYANVFRIFGNIISKCYNLIGKKLPLPAHSLYYSPSMQLKLFHHHYKTPCIMKIGSLFSILGVWLISSKSLLCGKLLLPDYCLVQNVYCRWHVLYLVIPCGSVLMMHLNNT